jgi:DNA invertase Pin-like site-specific DNA recombinase
MGGRPRNSLTFSVDSSRNSLAHAKAQGKILGRPKVAQQVEAEILKLRGDGVGQLKIAKTLGIGTGTVQRVFRDVA